MSLRGLPVARAVMRNTTVFDGRFPPLRSGRVTSAAGPQVALEAGRVGTCTPAATARLDSFTEVTSCGVQRATFPWKAQTDTPSVQLPFCTPSTSHAGSPS